MAAIITMPLTAERAQAIALEAGDRHARDGGRQQWSRDDYLVAIAEFLELTKGSGDD